jgi:beta-glucosidase
VNGVKEKYLDPSLSPEERAEDLLKRMSREEKLGQIQCYGSLQSGGKKVSEVYPHGVGEVSCLITSIMEDPKQTAGYIRIQQEDIMQAGEHHIPALFHVETLSGVLMQKAAAFPSGIAQAAAWNPELLYRMGKIIGTQARTVGLNEGLSPVLDISRDPRFGRQGETYGEDPTLASALGTACVKGMQEENHIAATAKHFLAFQSGEGGIHTARASVSSRELREVYAKPFQAAVTEGKIMGIMNAYNTINRQPVASSKEVLQKLLREEMGFSGITVSDYGSIGQLASVFHVAETKEDAGALALQTGIDSDLPYLESYTDNLLKRIEEGSLDEEVLDRAVRHILTVKFRLGLFENPYPADDQMVDQVFDDPEAEKTSRQMAHEGLVLLKNDGILPLDEKPKKIAVIGYHMHSVRALFGGYSFMSMKESSVGVRMTMAGVAFDDPPQKENGPAEYPGTPVHREDSRVDGLVRQCYPGIQSVYESLKKIYPDSRFIYARGYDYAGTDESDFAEVLQACQDADVIILSLGGKYGWNMSSTTGEGIDASEINLPTVQEKFLRKLQEQFPAIPKIGIHFDGRPLSSDAADETLSAMIEAFSPGPFGGEAIADVLSGKYNPGGKMPVSTARNAGQIPVYYNHEYGSGTDTGPSAAFNDYVDCSRQPRYPFGYGLSYTAFKMGNLKTDRESYEANDMITVSCEVTNTGSRTGSEVLQLYVSDVCASCVRPVKELAGFRRVELHPGETKQVVFHMKAGQLAFLDENMQWKVEKGKMILTLGNSSADVQDTVSFTIGHDGIVEGRTRGFFAEAEEKPI